MFKYLSNIWKNEVLRQKILFVLFAIIVFRLVAHIPVPGVDTSSLSAIFDSNSILGVFSALTGGSMESFSIVMMGLAPYINASIIMQLMTVVLPYLERLKKDEGEEGQKKINLYTRYLTVPLAIMQSYGMIALMNISAQSKGLTLIDMNDLSALLPAMIIIASGSIFLMWLGELMTENGIGNGISLIIFTGIVSAIPPIIGNILGVSAIDSAKILPFLVFLGITLIMLIAIVIFSESARNISVTYASSGNKAVKANLPIRLNQAGMIPIIFAIAVVTFPSIIAQFLQNSSISSVASGAKWIIENLTGNNPSWFYIIFYFLLVMGFTFFYVSISFKPKEVAENIQKRGGFITGLRPGTQTSEFIDKVSANLNLWGGGFLAFVAVLPLIFTKYTDLSQTDLLITGSGLIIVVGVVLELIRQINSQMIANDYDKIK